MLKELIEYHDCLACGQNSDFVDDGYMKVGNVSYRIVLTQDGKLKDILPNTRTDNNGKKPREVGYDEIFPFSESFSGIKAKNFIDYREKYIFGFDGWDEDEQCFKYSEKSSLKAFEENKKNIVYFEDISSPVIDAYKLFLNSWEPSEQTQNEVISKLGKAYNSAKFIIVVEGHESREEALNNDSEVMSKWSACMHDIGVDDGEEDVKGQCSITGEMDTIARIHDNLSGIAGGQSSGVNLVCFKTSAFWSYGKEQSFNSAVSVSAMRKYTKAFNYLTSSQNHKKLFNDMTLLFWANTKEKEEAYLEEFIDELEDADDALYSTAIEMKKGRYTDFELDENIEFCILGIKPNVSRLAIKMFEKNTFGNIMARFEKHQNDMKLSKSDRQLSINAILNALKFPKRDGAAAKETKEELSPDIFAKLFDAILHERPYPEQLLQTVIRRAKVDKDNKKMRFYAVSSTRARIIKGCLVRSKYYKGDEYMIDSEKQTAAFLCGRLFAVLEKIQEDAIGRDINATIKDKFFASACSNPSIVFPRLIKLSQTHLSKMKKDNKESRAYYREKSMSDILSKIEEFPKSLSLQKQGDFILGYYQEKTYTVAAKEEEEK